jgi:TRAP-type uncharacterized transport system fused permease subunit
MAAYAAAGIAEAPPMKTGLQASRVGLCGFIVPYMFVFGPALLMIGSPLETIWAFITASVGAYVLSCSLIGWMFGRLNIPLRILAFIGALGMVRPGLLTDVIGFAIIAFVIAANRVLMKKKADSKTDVAQ